MTIWHPALVGGISPGQYKLPVPWKCEIVEINFDNSPVPIFMADIFGLRKIVFWRNQPCIERVDMMWLNTCGYPNDNKHLFT